MFVRDWDNLLTYYLDVLSTPHPIYSIKPYPLIWYIMTIHRITHETVVILKLFMLTLVNLIL